MSTDVSDVYAVIRTGGKQYRVSPGQRLKVERLDGAAGDRITFDDVLLVQGGGDVAVGSPTVASASVSGEIVEQGRGRKIHVFKYKNKTRYRRLRGHRQLHTAVRVDEVSLGDQTWTAPAPTPASPEPPAAELDELDEPQASEDASAAADAQATEPEDTITEATEAVVQDGDGNDADNAESDGRED